MITSIIGLCAFALAACLAACLKDHPACTPRRQWQPPVGQADVTPSDLAAARAVAKRKQAHMADRARWADKLLGLDVVG